MAETLKKQLEKAKDKIREAENKADTYQRRYIELAEIVTKNIVAGKLEGSSELAFILKNFIHMPYKSLPKRPSCPF